MWMKDGCRMAPHKLLLTKPACVDASQDGSREILNPIRSDPSRLQLAHAPTSFRPWQAARYGREPRVDGSGLVARRAERFWLIFGTNAIIAAISPDLPRQIQANCPLRRVEI